ncbi:hypothetical protein GQX73_g8863 [Xylaria multiplex]|uniref:Uncharacterized protein n=1 Tax=Xylaria multiplex TaxID=323545 RepID=A0A7C8MKA8_9PEZI|nr:hypothetical protein GQX73_g8863 [Xylaria multiplex]
MDSASNLPMSPWADRYRDTQLTITEDGMKHSLLAPRYPELKDPKYYDQDPDPKEAHPPTNNKDIDRLLWSETLQKVRLGLRTYQLTVLNRRLMFPTSDGLRPMPGGHRQTSQLHLSRPLGIRKLSGSGKVSGLRKFNFQDFWFSSGSYGSLADSLRPDFQTYKQERIKVDQNTWLPFLRKDRWFDWHSYSLMEPTQPTQPTVTWSVDDEELWSGLSVVLELVNRILLALLIEKHDSGKKTLLYLKSNQNLIFMVVILRTMIFGRWDFWDNLEDVFGPPPSEDATVLLSYEKEQVVCNKRGTNVCEFKQTVDKTVPEARDRLILLLSKLIWTFTDTYDCARYFDDNYIGNCIDEEKDDRDYRPGATREPYLDAEGMHEAGWYMEQSIFGGVVDLVPMADDTRTVCPPLILYFTQWPHIFEKDKFKPADSKSAYLQDGAKYLKYHTPSTWSSKLLSETFWNSPAFPRKSDNFFHNPRLFYTEATVQGDKLQEKSNGRLHAIQISDEPDQPENQYPETREILNDWNNQVDLWTQMRVPW